MVEIFTPWTETQIEKLKERQQANFHPYTCSKMGRCSEKGSTVSDVLIPAKDGWVCACGEYKQFWAHGMDMS